MTNGRASGQPQVGASITPVSELASQLGFVLLHPKTFRGHSNLYKLAFGTK